MCESREMNKIKEAPLGGGGRQHKKKNYTSFTILVSFSRKHCCYFNNVFMTIAVAKKCRSKMRSGVNPIKLFWPKLH